MHRFGSICNLSHLLARIHFWLGSFENGMKKTCLIFLIIDVGHRLIPSSSVMLKLLKQLLVQNSGFDVDLAHKYVSTNTTHILYSLSMAATEV